MELDILEELQIKLDIVVHGLFSKAIPRSYKKLRLNPEVEFNKIS